MSTITLARIYEKQGHLDDALAIYKTLQKENSKNTEVQKAIKRISGIDASKVSYFVNMHTKEQFKSFEKWLVKPWS